MIIMIIIIFFFSLSTFIDNQSSEGATIGITNFPFLFKGTNTISRNEGPGLIVSCNLRYYYL